MLFSLAPKLRKNDLFDRGRELSTLRSTLQMYPLTLVTGLRRVGKSFLIRVFLNESNFIRITMFNEVVKVEDNFFVVCFDEAQYFRFYGSMG